MKQKPIFVVPKAGTIVRNPDGNYQPLPTEGAWVNPSAYWLGQLRDGSVTESQSSAAEPERTHTTRIAPPKTA